LSQHHKYLEDLSIRLICVFALDRFGDFDSDQVVTPVRETCAQTLGVVLKYMQKDGVSKVLSCLLQLQNHSLWEIRHGGLLGLRFILAVRSDLAAELLPFALPFIISGLLDRDDDVRAVAADALLPVSDLLLEVCEGEIPRILIGLWDSLLELDDLTASTSSIMLLLCSYFIDHILPGKLLPEHSFYFILFIYYFPSQPFSPAVRPAKDSSSLQKWKAGHRRTTSRVDHKTLAFLSTQYCGSPTYRVENCQGPLRTSG